MCRHVQTSTPPCFEWIKRISYATYGYSALVKNEFQGLGLQPADNGFDIPLTCRHCRRPDRHFDRPTDNPVYPDASHNCDEVALSSGVELLRPQNCHQFPHAPRSRVACALHCESCGTVARSVKTGMHDCGICKVHCEFCRSKNSIVPDLWKTRQVLWGV